MTKLVAVADLIDVKPASVVADWFKWLEERVVFWRAEVTTHSFFSLPYLVQSLHPSYRTDQHATRLRSRTRNSHLLFKIISNISHDDRVDAGIKQNNNEERAHRKNNTHQQNYNGREVPSPKHWHWKRKAASKFRFLVPDPFRRCRPMCRNNAGGGRCRSPTVRMIEDSAAGLFREMSGSPQSNE